MLFSTSVCSFLTFTFKKWQYARVISCQLETEQSFCSLQLTEKSVIYTVYISRVIEIMIIHLKVIWTGIFRERMAQDPHVFKFPSDNTNLDYRFLDVTEKAY